jgi:hypothetical protein
MNWLIGKLTKPLSGRDEFAQVRGNYPNSPEFKVHNTFCLLGEPGASALIMNEYGELHLVQVAYMVMFADTKSQAKERSSGEEEKSREDSGAACCD